MLKVGLISDTHGFIDKHIVKYFNACDEIWHAGDIGNEKVIEELEKICTTRAVFGNIDGGVLRKRFPENIKMKIEGLKVWITHIGGYPKRYDKRVKQALYHNPPDLFICGHSHITKVIRDKELGLLHINPGAAGIYGFHKVRTIARFIIESAKIRDLEIIELGPKTKIIK